MTPRNAWVALTAVCVAAVWGCATEAPPEPSVSYGEATSADGVTIRYEVRGRGEPTLVLVPGWTNSRAIFGQHPETLAKEHRVVALDLAGHGVSDANRADWSVEAFGQDIVAVADQLGLEDVVLVGFSMGGAVIIEAADQLGDRVAGLVFIDTIQDPDTFLAEDQALEQMVAAMRANWNDPAFVRAFAFTPEAPDSLIDYVIRIQPEELDEYQVTVLYAVHDWVGTEMNPTLASLDVPIAAINTTNEPTNVEALRRYDPGFTVDTMEGVGHAGILLRRVDDFDARLLAIVDRFAADRAAAGGDD